MFSKITRSRRKRRIQKREKPTVCYAKIALVLCFIQSIICSSFAQEISFVSEKSEEYFGAIRIVFSGKESIEDIYQEDLVHIYLKEFYDRKNDLPPMMGQAVKTIDAIYFIPRFPFQPNQEYVVEYRWGELVIDTIKITGLNQAPQAAVTSIFPSAEVWPANLLKIYIEYSSPMGYGHIYDHIKLFNANNQEVEDPFLEIDPPLWDSKQQRLTLWFDPGRIKQHLSPNHKMGPPLEENKNYRLVISKEVQDTSIVDYERFIQTTKEDRTQPSVDKWDIVFPTRSNDTPLTIQFPESMDYGTLYSTLGVVDEHGHTLAGRIAIGTQEKSWSFHPEENWQVGTYYLMISEKIEDLAGNNLKRLFDTNIVNTGLRAKESPINTETKMIFKIE